MPAEGDTMCNGNDGNQAPCSSASGATGAAVMVAGAWAGQGHPGLAGAQCEPIRNHLCTILKNLNYTTLF